MLRLMAVNLAAPDHTTLSRWNRNVDVPQPTSSHEGPFHLIVDSTGLKIFGAGEWNSRKHRKAKDRYRQQARVEGAFLRYKRTLGCGLQARGLEAQTRESMIGCGILNRMLELGRSDSVAVTG